MYSEQIGTRVVDEEAEKCGRRAFLRQNERRGMDAYEARLAGFLLRKRQRRILLRRGQAKSYTQAQKQPARSYAVSATGGRKVL